MNQPPRRPTQESWWTRSGLPIGSASPARPCRAGVTPAVARVSSSWGGSSDTGAQTSMRFSGRVREGCARDAAYGAGGRDLFGAVILPRGGYEHQEGVLVEEADEQSVNSFGRFPKSRGGGQI